MKNFVSEDYDKGSTLQFIKFTFLCYFAHLNGGTEAVAKIVKQLENASTATESAQELARVVIRLDSGAEKAIELGAVEECVKILESVEHKAAQIHAAECLWYFSQMPLPKEKVRLIAYACAKVCVAESNLALLT